MERRAAEHELPLVLQQVLHCGLQTSLSITAENTEKATLPCKICANDCTGCSPLLCRPSAPAISSDQSNSASDQFSLTELRSVSVWTPRMPVRSRSVSARGGMQRPRTRTVQNRGPVPNPRHVDAADWAGCVVPFRVRICHRTSVKINGSCKMGPVVPACATLKRGLFTS